MLVSAYICKHHAMLISVSQPFQLYKVPNNMIRK